MYSFEVIIYIHISQLRFKYFNRSSARRSGLPRWLHHKTTATNIEIHGICSPLHVSPPLHVIILSIYLCYYHECYYFLQKAVSVQYWLKDDTWYEQPRI